MSTLTPFFSVIMPTYNCAPFIEDAIESVLQQTFADFELLVRDDGSTDETLEIVQRLAARDPRINVFQRRSGARGPGANRNRGLDAARGAWVKFLDGDDLWPADHLELCCQAIARHADTAIFFGDYKRFRSVAEDIAELCVEGKGFFDPSADFVADVAVLDGGIEMFHLRPDRLLRFCCLFYCPISTQTVTLNGAILRASGIRFREDWFINEDFHVWMRMLECGPAVALRRVLSFYRINPASLTSNVIRYHEGMARSHGYWMRRLRGRLSAADQRTYREKVGAFLHAVAWERARQGRVVKAGWAGIRAAWVLRRPRLGSLVLRSSLRALLCRLRDPQRRGMI